MLGLFPLPGAEMKNKRLGRYEGEQIVTELEAFGFRVVKVGTPLFRISIWLPKVIGANEDQSYLGSLRWVAKLGWRLELVHPPLRTHTDWALAKAQILGIQETLRATSEAWDHYQEHKTKDKWMSYLGALAAFYMGEINDTDQGTTRISGPDDSEIFGGMV